jgi:DNA-binding transcriptional LysR family regulator
LDFVEGIRKDAFMVDLRRLRALRAVADHGTLAAAADALHLTPSAVSQQLSALERDVGRALLEPAGRSVRLTPAAHVLLTHADALFAQLERLDGELAAQDSAPRGTVRVGGFPTALAGLLAPAARPLRTLAPAVELRVLEAETPGAVALLVARDVDLILGMECSAAPRRDDARFHREDLLGDILDAVLGADHALAGRARIDLAELAGETWVAPPVGWSCDEVFMAGCRTAGYTPKIAHRAGDWQATMGLVAAGLGISLVPRLAHTAPPPGVVIVPLLGVPPQRHVFAACRAGAESSPAIRAVLDALGDAARAQTPLVRVA